MKKIILTGGGSAGHVTPNLALAAQLQERGYDIVYIGSHDGMEKAVVEEAGLPYRSIATGKLRRYLSIKNLTDPFRVIKGIGDAKKVLQEEQPALIFAKGGFVSLPVVKAAKKLGIPVFLHESDMTPGLANKLCFKDAEQVFCNFPETLDLLPAGKAFVSGCPIRETLRQGSREAALALTGFSGEKPVLLQIGGSLGALALNEMLRAALPDLLPHFDIIHLCGKGKVDESAARPGYVQFEFLSKEMKDIFALTDIAFSRAGANAICELLFLQIPALLVPLPLSASRGDQILNAKSFAAQGFARMVEQEQLDPGRLVRELLNLYENRQKYQAAMQNSVGSDAVSFICQRIDARCQKEEAKMATPRVPAAKGPKRIVMMGGLVILIALLLAGGFIFLAPFFESDKKEQVFGSEDWMQDLPDSLRLNEISIPGTHDSGTTFVQMAYFAKCQSKTITAQLEAGFRILDIRLALDGEKLILTHGSMRCKQGSMLMSGSLTLDMVLSECRAFLSAHPSETILFFVKKELEKDDLSLFQSTLSHYINVAPSVWLLTDQIPTLEEARGKIVLLRRYQDINGLGESAGIPLLWEDQGNKDHTELHIQSHPTGAASYARTLWVQDRYQYNIDEKWAAFTEGIKNAEYGADSVVLHYLSTKGSGALGHPYGYAGKLNARLLAYEGLPDLCGWIMMDFGTAPLAAHIYRQNYR